MFHILFVVVFSREETENALLELQFLGIRNLLVVRGDPDKSLQTFIPEQGGNKHAVDLVRQVMDLNKGKYLDDEIQKSDKNLFFCWGWLVIPKNIPKHLTEKAI